jgi:hypothetical protein
MNPDARVLSWKAASASDRAVMEREHAVIVNAFKRAEAEHARQKTETPAAATATKSIEPIRIETFEC